MSISFAGSNRRIRELPGAALLCFPTRKDMRNQGTSKVRTVSVLFQMVSSDSRFFLHYSTGITRYGR